MGHSAKIDMTTKYLQSSLVYRRERINRNDYVGIFLLHARLTTMKRVYGMFMWVALAASLKACLHLSSPSTWVALAGPLECFSPLVCLYVGGLGRNPRILVSAWRSLCPFM